jgi:hypothetical protein
MATTKLTHKDRYNRLSAIVALALENELIEEAEATDIETFIDGRIEAINKKNGADRKPTKTQVANESLAQTVLDTMELGKLYTISELIKVLPNQENGEPYTQSKISAIVRSMVTVTAKGVVNPDGVIERTEEKGKAYFRKLDIEE